MTSRALAFAFALLLVASSAHAHPNAPIDWWADAAEVCGRFPRWFEDAGVVREDYPDGSFVNYASGIGQCAPSTTRFFSYLCNYLNGDRHLWTFDTAGGYEDRHGVYHYLGKRLPCN